ncbi:MAG TPA: alpha-amylase family glycosyl hydrolase [Bryobacteraceae bacterium]|nr:alpha-amylase family glycosyl hydrolase [Bryobacteraceae bacterium]
MPESLFSKEFQSIYSGAKDTGHPVAFPSPLDWRDQWIYFLMVDRFNNRNSAIRHQPFDDPGFFGFQGGKFSGIQDRLAYIKGLGAGAIWLSPVLKNVPFEEGTYHGYGIHNFLQADPRFADDPAHADDELRSLVDAAHAAGLYVILDIVLNHTGNVFAYPCDPGESTCSNSDGAEADFRPSPRPILWRDPSGQARPDEPDIAAISTPPADALVWPKELHDNAFFRRQGSPGPGDDTSGDFASLKQFRTDVVQLQQFLIRSYQYVVARFDVDGFRIDTLRYLKGGFPLLFGNSIREYALSIGKKNFFTFGEVFTGDAEEQIARFIGRSTTGDDSDMVGVDAALDYPLFFNLKPVVKGFSPPSDLVGMYQLRKRIEATVLSSHGDATRYFVTFLDNHDVKERIRFVQPGNEHEFDDQVTLGLACLYSLPGVPCLYYGTEAGLDGKGSDPAVREALWGGPGFDQTNPFYKQIARISAVRAQTPPLRYGRFYFRPVSGDGRTFGVSSFPQGLLAFSRILVDEEVVIAANMSTSDTRTFDVIVDIGLSKPGDEYRIAYSNKASSTAPEQVVEKAAGSVSVQEATGGSGTGPLHSIRVTLAPLEVQILRR